MKAAITKDVSSNAITSVELFVVWSISIVVFGSVGYFSITYAVRLAGWLGLS